MKKPDYWRLYASGESGRHCPHQLSDHSGTSDQDARSNKEQRRKMNLIVKVFDELTAAELYEILKSRAEVFMLEQNIKCQDMDNVDYKSIHCFLRKIIGLRPI